MASTIDTVIDAVRRATAQRSTNSPPGGPAQHSPSRCSVRGIAAHPDPSVPELQPAAGAYPPAAESHADAAAGQDAEHGGGRRPRRINNLIDAEIAEARSVPRPDDHMSTMSIMGRGDEGHALSEMTSAPPDHL